MKVLIIGGFLGSGKTTLLLQLAKKLSLIPKRVAIIENEIGEIGIDGKYLSLEGLAVQELYGGCICCSLRSDLRTTLGKVNQNIKPEWVLLEPTGAAYPGDIVDNIIRDVDYIDEYRVFILIDPVRYEMLLEMMTPLLTAQIDAADVIIINKIDEIDEETIKSVTASLMTLFNREKPIIKISAEKKINIDSLFREIW